MQIEHLDVHHGIVIIMMSRRLLMACLASYANTAALNIYSGKVNIVWVVIMLQEEVHSIIRQRNLQGCLIDLPTSMHYNINLLRADYYTTYMVVYNVMHVN